MARTCIYYNPNGTMYRISSFIPANDGYAVCDSLSLLYISLKLGSGTFCWRDGSITCHIFINLDRAAPHCWGIQSFTTLPTSF